MAHKGKNIYYLARYRKKFANAWPRIVRSLDGEKKAGGGSEQFIKLMRPRIPGSRSFQCSMSFMENQANKKVKCAQILESNFKNIFSKRPPAVSRMGHPMSNAVIGPAGIKAQEDEFSMQSLL